MLIAPRPLRCGRTSYAYGWAHWLIFWFVPCGGSGCSTPPFPTRVAARYGSSCSRSVLMFASAFVGLSLRWPPFGAALPAASMLPRGSVHRPPETCAAAARNNRGIILRPMETTLFVVVVASHKCSLRSRTLTPRASTAPHQLKRDLAQTARLCKVSVRNPG